jgi:hypothetical protein
LIGLKETGAIQTKVVELNGIILSAQSSALAAQSNQFTLLQRVGDLEKEIAGFKAWDTEKQRYELAEVAPSVFTYRLKPEMGQGEPVHQICAACYKHGKPSILQRWDKGIDWILKCPECKTDFKIGTSTFAYEPGRHF